MRIGIFLGPSLHQRVAREIADVMYFEPAQRGDIYRAVSRFRLDCIGLVDGYFQQAPSVWHKEVLWAMQASAHVLGAASMGALRSAELCDYGMVGVGQVFESYRMGQFFDPAGRVEESECFEDDDEVALIHGPAITGYRAASVPMVNIRATLASAQRSAVLDANTARHLIGTAKAMHYSERNWPSLIEAARLPSTSLANALRDFSAECPVDIKAADTQSLLRRITALEHPREPVDYALEQTDAWLSLVRSEEFDGP